jgi:hypothetical protein
MKIWKRLRLSTTDRPTLSSEWALQEDKDCNGHHLRLKSGHESQKGLDTKTDWLTGRQSQRDSDSDSDQIHQYPEDEDRDGSRNVGFFAS